MPRTKGSKNKKTLLKEQKLHVGGNLNKLAINEPAIQEEPKQRVAVRLFTLEKKVHDDFINHISQLGDHKFYESYIVNEIMTKYVNGKIKLPKIDYNRMKDYMVAYGHVGFENATVDEMSDFKAANRLIHKPQNSFIQFQYPIIVDPDIKTSIDNPSYTINECLKLYMNDTIKIDLRDFRVKEWGIKYNYVLKKKVNHNV